MKNYISYTHILPILQTRHSIRWQTKIPSCHLYWNFASLSPTAKKRKKIRYEIKQNGRVHKKIRQKKINKQMNSQLQFIKFYMWIRFLSPISFQRCWIRQFVWMKPVELVVQCWPVDSILVSRDDMAPDGIYCSRRKQWHAVHGKYSTIISTLM